MGSAAHQSSTLAYFARLDGSSNASGPSSVCSVSDCRGGTELVPTAGVRYAWRSRYNTKSSPAPSRSSRTRSIGPARPSLVRPKAGSARFDARAARFCAIGALNRAARELLGIVGVEHAHAAEGFVLAANGRHHHSLPLINDIDGHEVIVAMFKVALAQ